MTQEEKLLLLKDLSARLPYHVMVHYHWSRESRLIDEDRELDFSDVETLQYNIENQQNDWCEISWKPYLRPMSSMTDDERDEFRNVGGVMSHNLENDTWAISAFTPEAYDWLNAHYFDFRGLILMGLALVALEGMYKTE